jgi:macrolide-specific efflux system membrane fusion protein
MPQCRDQHVRSRRARAGAAMLAIAAALAACSKPAPDSVPPGRAPAPQYVAMARGRVDVEGGLVRIVAPRDGVIAELPVKAGDAVKAGDLIATIDTREAELAAGVARAEVEQAQARAAALRAKSAGLKQRAARVTEAAQAGAATGQSADDAGQALTELNADIAEAEAGIAVAEQHLKQARLEVELRRVHAPVAGRIVSRAAHLAEVVSAQGGSEIATLLPDAPRIVRAELNEAFVAKVRVGMNASVVSEADAGKSWPAKVVRIGDVFGPSKLAEDPQDTTDARDVECVLELATDELRVGQRVQVRFLPQ